MLRTVCETKQAPANVLPTVREKQTGTDVCAVIPLQSANVLRTMREKQTGTSKWDDSTHISACLFHAQCAARLLEPQVIQWARHLDCFGFTALLAGHSCT
jgi:predicted RecB family nuclease